MKPLRIQSSFDLRAAAIGQGADGSRAGIKDARRGRALYGLAAGLLLLVMAAGCETRVVGGTGWNQGMADRFEPAKPAADSGNFLTRIFGGSSESEKGNWAIAVASYKGVGHAEQAKALVENLKANGLNDPWIMPEPAQTTVWHGHYKDGNSKQAAEDGAVLRKLGGFGIVKRGNYVPQPVTEATAGKVAEWDLRTAATHGRYTLQVGYYEDPDLKKRAAAAEAFVKVLRDKGEEAYYFHGPNRSLVTVGAFPHEAVNAKNEFSPVIEAAQRKFPHHAVNGYSQRVRRTDMAGKEIWIEQPSFVVQIPGSPDKAPTRRAPDRVEPDKEPIRVID